MGLEPFTTVLKHTNSRLDEIQLRMLAIEHEPSTYAIEEEYFDLMNEFNRLDAKRTKLEGQINTILNQ